MYFEEIMNAEFYMRILERYLLPFIHETLPGGTHCFMQDNPKHKSRMDHMQKNGLNNAHPASHSARDTALVTAETHFYMTCTLFEAIN